MKQRELHRCLLRARGGVAPMRKKSSILPWDEEEDNCGNSDEEAVRIEQME